MNKQPWQLRKNIFVIELSPFPLMAFESNLKLENLQFGYYRGIAKWTEENRARVIGELTHPHLGIPMRLTTGEDGDTIYAFADSALPGGNDLILEIGKTRHQAFQQWLKLSCWSMLSSSCIKKTPHPRTLEKFIRTIGLGDGFSRLPVFKLPNEEYIGVCFCLPPDNAHNVLTMGLLLNDMQNHISSSMSVYHPKK